MSFKHKVIALYNVIAKPLFPLAPSASSTVKEPVYHGTNANFDKFETGVEGSRFILFSEFKVKSQGLFFSESIEDAKHYGKKIIECYVSLKNPLVDPRRDKHLAVDRLPPKKEKDLITIFEPLAEDEGGARYIDMMIHRINIKPDDNDWIYELIDSGGVHWDVMDDPGVIQRMKKLGYDGTFVHEPDDKSGRSIFVFSPDQVQIIPNSNNEDEQ